MPSKLKSKNVSLMWLYNNIENCKTVATGIRMFMLLFIGILLCLDLGTTVSLHYLWSLRDIGQIKNYDWGGMAYTTLLHFMTQLSRHSLSSLGGAPFVWQVRFWIFGYVWVLESHFGRCAINDICWFFFQLWMYKYFEVGPQVLEDVGYSRFLCWLPKYRLSTPFKNSLQVWHMVSVLYGPSFLVGLLPCLLRVTTSRGPYSLSWSFVVLTLPTTSMSPSCFLHNPSIGLVGHFGDPRIGGDRS